jgi:hypothetical protein
MTTAAASDHAGTASRLKPDLDQARQFLELLDPDAESFTFQTFDDSPLKRGHLAKVLHGQLDDHERHLTALQASGAGVFITVSATDLRGRKAMNVTRVRAVFVDLDGSPLQPVLACRLEPHVIVESSPGRWHAYWIVEGLPLDQFASVQKALIRRFAADPSVHDSARVMRLAGFAHQKGEPFLTRITHIADRMPYTAEQILAEFPPRAGNGAASAEIDDAHPSALTPEILDELRKALEGDTHGGWHNTMLKLVARLVHDGASDWFIVDWALQYRWPGYSAEQTRRDVEQMIAGARAKGFHRAQAQGRPEIDVVGGNFALNVRQSIAALQHAAVAIYDRGGMLVRPVEQATAYHPGIRRAAGSIILAPVTADWARVTLAEVAAWRRFDLRTEKWKPTDPPPDVPRTIVNAPDLGCWPYPRAIVRHPVLLPSGRRITAQGYDRETGLLIDAPGAWPPLPDRPTRDDAQAAVETLQHLLRYFPWASDADCAVALSLVLTALMSPILDAVPGHAVDAPTYGTGKSTLVDAVSIVAYGTPAAVLDYGQDPDEATKRLDSALLAGDPMLHIDNVDAPLEGAGLCQTITQTARRLRLLGSNSMVTVPCNILITATGNNLTLRGDIVRRMLVCRLDAQCERPEEREIPQDLLAEVTEQRGELVCCAQTVMAAYACAGRPSPGLTPIGSFEAWSRLVRAPLVWAGAADPVTTISRARNDDPSVQARVAVLTACHDACGASPFTVASLISLAEARAENAAAELKEALSLIALRGGKLDGNRLGNWLRRNRDCRVARLTLRHAGEVGATGGAKWMVLPR